jgi:hypothetical protein
MYEREWMCCFCLTVSEQKGFDNRPERCQACHVVRCPKCGTYIKGDSPRLCHGCGEFMPKAQAAFVGCDKTASVYVEAEWCRRNKGRDATGDYRIGTGFKDSATKEVSSWIIKEVSKEGGMVGSEDVRELSEDEKRQLNE